MTNFEKKIVVRIQNEKALSDIACLYGNINNGTKKIIDNYLALRTVTLQELKGKFTQDELIWLISRYTSSIFDPKMACNKNITLAGLEDFYKFENQDIDLQPLLDKIAELTTAQAFILTEWCLLFWDNADKQNIDEYAKTLV